MNAENGLAKQPAKSTSTLCLKKPDPCYVINGVY